ncbi:hypothetical protein TELCIR_20959, partial [Teladorsagia circumcincta]
MKLNMKSVSNNSGLCSYAGLHCVVIKGYSKSAGYQPGYSFEDNRFRNAKESESENRSDGNLRYEYDDHYFMTDPEIICDSLQVIMVPLPECASGEWGPAKATRLFGLQPVSHFDAIVNAGRSVEIKF